MAIRTCSPPHPSELTGSGYADAGKALLRGRWILAREVAGKGFQEEPLRIMDGVVEAVVACRGRHRPALNPASVESQCSA